MRMEIHVVSDYIKQIRYSINRISLHERPYYIDVQLRKVIGDILKIFFIDVVQRNRKHITNFGSYPCHNQKIPNKPQFLGAIELILFKSCPPYFPNPY